MYLIRKKNFRKSKKNKALKRPKKNKTAKNKRKKARIRAKTKKVNKSKVSRKKISKQKIKKKIEETIDLQKMEIIHKNIYIIQDVKNNKNKKLILKNEDFAKKGKIPKEWEKFTSNQDKNILLINKKGISVMVIYKNNKFTALRSVCPHMGVNNMWSEESKGKYRCWAHGNVFKSGKDLKKYKIVKKQDTIEIILPSETFSIFSGGSGKINEKCNHLRDIEDLV